MASRTYRIEKNGSLGRYMVADRDIKQGELILKEAPVLVGPQPGGALQCFACCRRLQNVRTCPGCDVALLCRPDCKGEFHPESECSYLASSGITGKDLADNCQVVFPLRCLLLKRYDPRQFDAVSNLEPHLEKRRNTPIWRRNKVAIEDVLKKLRILNQDELESELVQTVCGILDVNTFEIRPAQNDMVAYPERDCLRGLYVETAMMAHSCVPNVCMSADDSYRLSCHARVDIKRGDTIAATYANLLKGTAERQKHLSDGKYFECSCARCDDPTELGTELSSLRCHKCRKGLIRPHRSRGWGCDVCRASFLDGLITLAIREGERRIEDLDPANINAMEQLYKKLSLTFHPNHYLMLGLRQNMAVTYSRLPPTRHNLNRKLDLCARLLAVFSKLEPGISRIKALTMYELQSAMVDLSNKQYRGGEISRERFVAELKAADNILKEAVRYLLYEPPQSPEGRMALSAMTELKMLRESISSVLVERQEDSKKGEVARRLKEKLEQGDGAKEKK
ncbi:SET domain-containing protein SmydA-8-like [Cylas formicarius]|uniref:SET domain-containing protein SmydA-8-like n=1 Tax=Cylas formicarius TaxID=197179 RepID=UPI002958BB2F|nr:SET domain-containing protein SmydA-8-like [Cylas formicarius]